jgi:hypothetical protein
MEVMVAGAVHIPLSVTDPSAPADMLQVKDGFAIGLPSVRSRQP